MTLPLAIRCHWCGVLTTPAKARFQHEPLNEFGSERSWWECRDTCEKKSGRKANA